MQLQNGIWFWIFFERTSNQEIERKICSKESQKLHQSLQWKGELHLFQLFLDSLQAGCYENFFAQRLLRYHLFLLKTTPCERIARFCYSVHQSLKSHRTLQHNTLPKEMYEDFPVCRFFVHQIQIL